MYRMVEAFEFRDIRWAIVASKHRSLRQAAETLNIRQSTLSRRLRELEEYLGAALFERSNGGTRPTIHGLEFLEAAQRIVDDTEGLVTRLVSKSRGDAGCLGIGVHASLSAGNFRATLIEHQRRHTQVRVGLVDGTSERLLSDLASSSIDVAFVVDRDPPGGVRSISVWSERVVVALPDTHSLATHEAVQWHELKNEPLLLPQRGPGPEIMKLLFAKVGRPDAFDLRRHDVSLDRLLTLVGAGMGLLLALEGATGASYPGVVFREVHDNDGPTRVGFHAIWRPENGNPSLVHFLDMLRERYPDFSAEASVR